MVFHLYIFFIFRCYHFWYYCLFRHLPTYLFNYMLLVFLLFIYSFYLIYSYLLNKLIFLKCCFAYWRQTCSFDIIFNYKVCENQARMYELTNKSVNSSQCLIEKLDKIITNLLCFYYFFNIFPLWKVKKKLLTLRFALCSFARPLQFKKQLKAVWSLN